MKTTAAKIVSLVMMLSLLFTLSACSDLFSTTDYPTVDKLKQAIELNTNPAGKTVNVTVQSTIPNAAQGFIIQEGGFNFCLPSDPGVVPGDKIKLKITGCTRQTDAYYVTCQKA